MFLLTTIYEHNKKEVIRYLKFSIISALSATYCYYLINNAATVSKETEKLAYQSIQFIAALTVACLAQLKSLEICGPIIENRVHLIREKLFNKLKKIELQDAESLGTSRIISYISNDTLNISQIATPLAFTGQSFILSCIASVYLLWISISAFLLTALVSTLAIWAFLSHSKQVNSALESAQRQASEMQEHVISLVDGFKELKLSQSKAKDAVNEAVQSSAASIEYKLTAHKALSKDFILSQFALYALLGTMAFVLPLLNSAGSENVSESVAAVMFLVSPLFGMVGTVPQILAANLSASNLIEFEKLLDSLAEKINNTNGRSTSHDISNAASNNQPKELNTFNNITLKKVQFDYDKSNAGFNIGPLNLTINKGEVVFITGNNGAGKTTLLKILTGLYKPTSGEILYNEMSVWPEHVFSFRSLYAVVFSNFYLFKKLYGINEIDPEWIKLWLDRLQLSNKVKLTNGKFSTTKLSTGQRKRLALFAALAEKKPILILDEWAADQDPGFRLFFYNEIIPYIKNENITVIAITHDETYFNLADRRLHLESGTITQINKI